MNEKNENKLIRANVKELKDIAMKDPQKALQKLQSITEKHDGGWDMHKFTDAVVSFTYLAKDIANDVADDSNEYVSLSDLDDDRQNFDDLFNYIHKHPNDDYAVEVVDNPKMVDSDTHLRPVSAKDADKAIDDMKDFLA